MGNKTKDIKAIFWQAVEKENREEQLVYLKEACGSDAETRAKVEELLQAHEEADGFLDISPLAGNVTLDDSPLTEGPGTVIGRYKLLEKIGEGGFGVVYMADQTKPISRRVALKIIKLGMDTKEVIARFEAERQALAMMEHPNIAKVFDAGATDTGRPYFVMELVKGIPITKYCDNNNLNTKERTELFINVCKAIQHAHQKGIIHRDLKPSNVLITLHDGKPVPKVIDFGIAKATGQRLTEKTLFTRFAQMVGTPEYMSPEQAEFSGLDVDTRSDIYSLGVLLYQLLTGVTPFDGEKLREAGYAEMQRIIREDDPDKPSTKLSTIGEALTDIAKHRRVAPEALRKLIQGDLDWIVMKTLEKDRTRRYETANELAMDIQRHLEHEPVLARSPSATYRLQKFLYKHRLQAVATLILFVIVGVIALILFMWNRDRLQLAEAEGLQHRNILSRAREQHARADRDAAFETIKTILDSKHVGSEAQLLYAGILVDNRRSDEAVTILTDLLNKSPEIAGASHSLLARIIWENESPNAEKLKEIEQHRRKAEALLPDTAEAYFLRAMTAITIKEQLVSLDKALELDPTHYESRRLRAFTYYASRKYDLLRDDALVLKFLRASDPLGYSLRAVALCKLGKYTEAITEYDSAMARICKMEPKYIDLSIQRCEALLRLGDYEHLIEYAHECLKLSPDITVFKYYNFCALTAFGNYEKAEVMFREIACQSPTSRNDLRKWCAKYVFETLGAGHSWHPPDQKPVGGAFLPMLEAEETYCELSAKGHRLITDGFSTCWSPDGSKLAFSAGVYGYSGVAIYGKATEETELLIVPGKDPRWSPDGQYIAFVRDCQLLRLEELAAAEHGRQQRSVRDEEVWIMKSDGTEPRLIARGSWPSWGRDSEHIYYQSRVNNVLFSISIMDQNAKPKRIMKCSYSLSTVSPDNQYVSYFAAGKLKIKDMASQEFIVQCAVPSISWGVTSWSPTGDEVCIAGKNPDRETAGLWIYDLGENELLSILDGQIRSASWSSMETNLSFCLDLPYFEIWSAVLDPNVSTAEALGPGQTPDEHWDQMLRLYARRMQADPPDAYAYFDRARYYDYQHKPEKANTDIRRWSAITSGEWSSNFQVTTPQSIRRILSGPLDYQLIFSAERSVNEIPLINIAFGQKGRCKMKSFQIPIFSMSLLGLCLLSGLDTPPAHADFIFGDPVNLGPPINTSAGECPECFSADGLEMYMSSGRSGGQGGWDLWVTRREAIDNDWDTPINLGPIVNSESNDWTAYITADGLELYFCSGRSGGYGSLDIWVTKRAKKDVAWRIPENLGPLVNSSRMDGTPWLSSDGLELYFYSQNRPGGYGGIDIWISRRATKNDPWGEPVNLGSSVNSSAHDTSPLLTNDGLLLFFGQEIMAPYRPEGFGGSDMWLSRRVNISDPWGEPVNLGPIVNTPSHDVGPRISPDGSMLYFCSDRPGGFGGQWYGDIYQAPIINIMDFNGDGKVDASELCIMIEHWLTDYSLCDIGPMPWGDGVVNVEDLKVLAEHLLEELDDPTLIAHWPLDEVQGDIAYNNASDCDGTLQGDPIWQPDGGIFAGALQFNSIDDYVSTDFVLNPADSVFSVFAWIKGGEPGQVILSQETGLNWICLDSVEGYLFTELKGSGRSAYPLMSQTVISDGIWHRIGFVWDGLKRKLYVDGAVVAEDTQNGLANSYGGLYIGCGKGMEPDSFFSGLIDDIRIYNRVVHL